MTPRSMFSLLVVASTVLMALSTNVTTSSGSGSASPTPFPTALPTTKESLQAKMVTKDGVLTVTAKDLELKVTDGASVSLNALFQAVQNLQLTVAGQGQTIASQAITIAAQADTIATHQSAIEDLADALDTTNDDVQTNSGDINTLKARVMATEAEVKKITPIDVRVKKLETNSATKAALNSLGSNVAQVKAAIVPAKLRTSLSISPNFGKVVATRTWTGTAPANNWRAVQTGKGAKIESGVYILYVFPVDTFKVGGGFYAESLTSVPFYWYAGRTNSYGTNNVNIHFGGHANNNEYWYFRTARDPNNSDGYSDLEFRSNRNLRKFSFKWQLIRIA